MQNTPQTEHPKPHATSLPVLSVDCRLPPPHGPAHTRRRQRQELGQHLARLLQPPGPALIQHIQLSRSLFGQLAPQVPTTELALPAGGRWSMPALPALPLPSVHVLQRAQQLAQLVRHRLCAERQARVSGHNWAQQSRAAQAAGAGRQLPDSGACQRLHHAWHTASCPAAAMHAAPRRPGALGGTHPAGCPRPPAGSPAS
jgi:hypothetical protein